MISSRYLPALSVLLVLPLVPTFIHSYAGATASDTRVVATALGSVAGYRTTPTSRAVGMGPGRISRPTTGLERRYVSGDDDVVVTVVRLYNLKTLYHHPELACAVRHGFRSIRGQTLRRNDRTFPFTCCRPASDVTPLAYVRAATMASASSSIPSGFNSETAGQLLFSPRRPMTLFFAHDAVTAADPTDSANVEAVSLLFEAIDRYSASRPD